MRLRFDQNVSHRLVAELAREFPDSGHVREFDLSSASDETIWRFAAERGYVIVTKDDDLHQRSFLFGHPPKVIWLRVGNCSTGDVALLLRRNLAAIREFEIDSTAACLVLS